MNFSAKLALAASTWLAACTSSPPPPEVAALEFIPNKECSTGFTSTVAIDMQPEVPVSVTIRRSVLNADSDCLIKDDAAVPYALYQLPVASNMASINAGAIFEPERILGTQVQFLDAGLSPVRSFSVKDMLHRGSTLSVLVRPKDNERFVAIVADNKTINHAYNRSRPENGQSIAADSSPYSFLGLSFVRIYYHDPDDLDPRD